MPAINQVLWIDSDNLWTVDELKNKATGAFINGATVTMTLLESDQTTEVAGETWPISVPYVPASDGKYQATLRDTLPLVDKKKYFAKVVADAGTDLKSTWYVPCQALKRFE